MKKVVFLWSGISGYMVACWKAISSLDNLECHFIVSRGMNPWAASLVSDIPNFICLDQKEARKKGHMVNLVTEIGPDVLVVCGWHIPAFKAAVRTLSLGSCKFILAMDTPYKNNLRQYLAKYLLHHYLKNFSQVIVAGERTFHYARVLGFSDGQIKRGVYAADFNEFYEASLTRSKRDWPRNFLFVGRLSPEKGIEDLLVAYNQYRESVKNPWALTVCGKGPLSEIFETVEGVSLEGFVQPNDLVDYYAKAGAFVLPSRYEPWGVVVAEACAAGLPVITTESVNSSIDLVHSYYNGITTGTKNVNQLTNALKWIHTRSESELYEMGKRSIDIAKPYSAEMWAERWNYFIAEIS